MVDSASIGSDETLRSAAFTGLPSASMYALNPGAGGPGGPGGPDTFTYTYTVLLPLGLGLDEEAPLAPAAPSVPGLPGAPAAPSVPGEPGAPAAPGLPSLPGGPGGPLGAAQSSAVMHTRVGLAEYAWSLTPFPSLPSKLEPQHHIESSFMTAHAASLVA